MNEAAIADPQLASLFFRGLNNPDSLSPEEKSRHLILMNMQLNQTLKAHHSYKSGLLTEEEWRAMAIHFGEHLSTEGGRLYKKRVLELSLGQQPSWNEALSDVDRIWQDVKGA